MSESVAVGRIVTPGRIFTEVMNDGSGGREGLRAIIEAEASKFGNIKLFAEDALDRKSTRLNSSHSQISYAVFCLKKKKNSSNSTESVSASRRAPGKRGTPPELQFIASPLTGARS